MSAYSAAILGTSGLMSYWRLDESSGSSAADSFGTRTGTYGGTVSGYGVAGAIANDDDTAVTFNAGQVSVTNIGIQDTFTLSGWFKRTGATADRGLWGGSANGTINAYVGTNGQIVVNKHNVIALSSSTSNIDTSSWWNIVLTKANSTSSVLIYLNGADVTSQTNTGSLTAMTTFYIAASPAGTNRFVGSVDDVASFSRVLTPTEIAYLYNVGIGVIANDGRSRPTRSRQAIVRASVF